MSGPLVGVRVVDFSQIVSGPMAASVLAEQGAEVIKVESLGGDPVRLLGPRKGDLSAMFIAVNRGKRSIAVDLKTATGKAIITDLVARADVLIENFRPNVIDRLGLGFDVCRRLNKRLIYVSINGFGPSGPYANIRVYDPVVQAVSGLAALQTEVDGPPQLMRTLIADKTTALTAAQAITAALFARERTGSGQRIEIAMLDAMIAFNWPDGMWNEAFLDDPPPPWPAYGSQMRLWTALDGQVAIGALQDSEFRALCDAVGHRELATDPRLTSAAGRTIHRAVWTPLIGGAIATMTVEELMAAFIRTGAVGGRVNSIAEAVLDPQVVHNEMILTVDHGAAGRVAVPRGAARFGESPLTDMRPAPELGEHSRAILHELGRVDTEIDELITAGVVIEVLAAD